MASTMHAVVIDTPGGPEALEAREIPRPIQRPKEVLIRLEAFGVNRSRPGKKVVRALHENGAES